MRKPLVFKGYARASLCHEELKTWWVKKYNFTLGYYIFVDCGTWDNAITYALSE